MANKQVEVVDPETGFRTRVAESAFRKVWADRGYVLAADYDKEQAPVDEAEVNAEGGADASSEAKDSGEKQTGSDGAGELPPPDVPSAATPGPKAGQNPAVKTSSTSGEKPS